MIINTNKKKSSKKFYETPKKKTDWPERPVIDTIYYKLVPQHLDRGFDLLIGFDPNVIKHTAGRIISMGCVTPLSLNQALNKWIWYYSAKKLIDVTQATTKRKLPEIYNLS